MKNSLRKSCIVIFVLMVATVFTGFDFFIKEVKLKNAQEPFIDLFSEVVAYDLGDGSDTAASFSDADVTSEASVTIWVQDKSIYVNQKYCSDAVKMMELLSEMTEDYDHVVVTDYYAEYHTYMKVCRALSDAGIVYEEVTED